jgi:DNA polymerase IV
VRKVHGVGAVTARRMEESGIATIADLQRLPEQDLVARFGKFGQRLALYACGEDDRRVTPWRPVKSISAETTFRQDTGSPERLREIARALCERVAAQLVRKAVAGSGVVLKLKTSDFRLLTRSRRLSHPTQRAEVMFEAVAPLIDKEVDGRTFRLIGVGASELGSPAVADPTDLFSFAGSGQADEVSGSP